MLFARDAAVPHHAAARLPVCARLLSPEVSEEAYHLRTDAEHECVDQQDADAGHPAKSSRARSQVLPLSLVREPRPVHLKRILGYYYQLLPIISMLIDGYPVERNSLTDDYHLVENNFNRDFNIDKIDESCTVPGIQRVLQMGFDPNQLMVELLLKSFGDDALSNVRNLLHYPSPSRFLLECGYEGLAGADLELIMSVLFYIDRLMNQACAPSTTSPRARYCTRDTATATTAAPTPKATMRAITTTILKSLPIAAAPIFIIVDFNTVNLLRDVQSVLTKLATPNLDSTKIELALKQLMDMAQE